MAAVEAQKEQVTDNQGEVSPSGALRGVISTLVIIAICFAIYHYVLPDSYPTKEKKGLILLVFIGALWLTEVVHVTITALIVPVAAVVLFSGDGFTTKVALSRFADPIIFLFFGGFALATALHVQRLDRKIALFMIKISGGHLGVTVTSLFLVTAVLSMWISNTATAAMMLPLALGIMSNLDFSKDRGTFIFILLGIAYSASIGGLGTLVGSPPNAIAAKELGYSFNDWFKVGLPMMILLMPVMFAVLYFVFKPRLNYKVEITDEQIPWTSARVLAAIVFVVTAGAWIAGGWIKDTFGITSPDTFVAVACAIAVAFLGLASWKQISDSTDWGVLFLFGGGLTLSAVLGESGASKILGQTVADIFGGSPKLLVIFIVVAFIIVLTEFTSNTASAALLVPVFASIAIEMNMPPEALVLMIGLGASCAFMLPIATPPNAIVFGTGHLKQRDMMKAGGVLNLLCILILTGYGAFLLQFLA